MSHAQASRAASLQLLAGAAIIGSNGIMVRLAGMPPTAEATTGMPQAIAPRLMMPKGS